MNSLDDLIDRLNETGAMIWSRIEENSTFNTLRENFEAQSSSVQKLIIAGTISLIVLFIISIPLSSLFSSSDYVAEFEEKKDLIEKLLIAEQNQKKGSPIPSGLDSQALQTQVRNRLQIFRLVEGQGPQMAPLNNKPAGRLAPDILDQAGLQISLKGLNLKQTLDFGKALDGLHPSVKMLGMDIQASAQFPKYYDVVYRIVSFSFPQPAADQKETAAGGKGTRAKGTPKRTFQRKGK